MNFLTNILKILVDIYLLYLLELVRKYIKVDLEVILKSIKLVNDNDNFEYIDIKNSLYFLGILDGKLNSIKKYISYFLYNDEDDILKNSKKKVF